MPPRQLHSSLASNADRMFPITDSACSLTIVAVIVCHAYYKFDRIDVPHCPNVILSVVLCKSLDQELSLRVFIIFHQVKLIKIRNSAGILNLEYIHYRYIVEKTYRGSYGVFCVVFAHYTSSFARHRGIRMGWRRTFTPTLAIIRSSAQKKVTLSFRAHSKTIFIFFFFLCLFCHFILVVTRICVRPAYCLYRMSCSADTTLSNALPTLTCTCNCNYTKPFFRCLRKLLITFVTINIS